MHFAGPEAKPAPHRTSMLRWRERVPAIVALQLLLVVGATMRNAALLGAYVICAAAVLADPGILRSLRGRRRIVVLLTALVATVMLPLGLVRNPAALLHYTVALVSLVLAVAVTRDLRAYAAASRICLLTCQAALIAYLLQSDVTEFPLEHLVEHTSSNGITSALILVQANYTTALFLATRRLSLLTPFITLGICIIGYGRGSILGSAAICGICVFAYVMTNLRLRRVGPMIVLAGVFGAATWFGPTLIEQVNESTKLGAGLYDEPRERMINDYLGQINFATMIVGASYAGTSIESEFFGNPHNAFIRAHHLFGLPYVLAMLSFPLLMLLGRRDLAGTAYCGALLLVVFARSLTEPLLFPTPFDLFYFGICIAAARTARPARVRRRRPSGTPLSPLTDPSRGATSGTP